jgi:hypothetical protein
VPPATFSKRFGILPNTCLQNLLAQDSYSKDLPADLALYGNPSVPAADFEALTGARGAGAHRNGDNDIAAYEEMLAGMQQMLWPPQFFKAATMATLRPRAQGSARLLRGRLVARRRARRACA